MFIRLGVVGIVLDAIFRMFINIFVGTWAAPHPLRGLSR